MAARLSRLGARVRAIARPTSDTSALSAFPIDWHIGEMTDAALVKKAVTGVNVVMHLASSYRETFSSIRAQRDVHINGTKRLAEYASLQPDFRRFVHVSTVGVHGHIEQPPADETYRFSPGDDYQRTKLEAEQWIMEYGRETGLPVTTVRPAAIYGPGDRRLLKLFRMAKYPIVPLVGGGQCLYHLVHVDDMVDFMACAAVHPKAVQEAFICGGREPITIEEIISTVGRCYGVNNRFIRVPTAPLMALAKLCDMICSPLQIRPPLHPRRIAFFTKDRAFNTSKMESLLGFQAQVDNRTGLEQTAAWYARHDWIRVRRAPVMAVRPA
jgi:nucleoside-diphosphate-sugar epimerase